MVTLDEAIFKAIKPIKSIALNSMVNFRSFCFSTINFTRNASTIIRIITSAIPARPLTHMGLSPHGQPFKCSGPALIPNTYAAWLKANLMACWIFNVSATCVPPVPAGRTEPMVKALISCTIPKERTVLNQRDIFLHFLMIRARISNGSSAM